MCFTLRQNILDLRGDSETLNTLEFLNKINTLKKII